MTLRVAVAIVAGLCLVAMLQPCDAAISQGEAVINPAHPGACWVWEDSVAVPERGSYHFKSGCQMLSCFREGSELFFRTVSCGVIAAPDNCRIVKDLSKSYPECCGDIVC